MLKGRNNCYGCAACVAVCPVDAIQMKYNKEHFLYPEVDKGRCIDCKKCDQVCNAVSEKETIKKAYAVQLKEDEILKQSTSGGAITAIAKVILEKNGVICAATYSVLKGTEWLFIDNVDDLNKIRGSKYLQIPLTKECYQLVISQLETRPVLFVGTPCQVDAMKHAVPHKLQDKLYTVDIICGGVISEWIERLYEQYLEKKNKKKVIKRVFRGKRDGIWSKLYCSIVQYEDSSKEIRMGGEDLYTRVYTSERALRESCYHCKYTTESRVGDITVGDCWGIEKEFPDLNNIEKGVSLMLINSEKGYKINTLLAEVIQQELTEFVPEKMNKPLYAHTRRHSLRSIAYKLYDVFPFVMATNIISYRYLIKRILKGKGSL